MIKIRRVERILTHDSYGQETQQSTVVVDVSETKKWQAYAVELPDGTAFVALTCQSDAVDEAIASWNARYSPEAMDAAEHVGCALEEMRKRKEEKSRGR